MGRTILAVVTGLVAACLLFAALQGLVHLSFPPPEGLPPSVPEGSAALLEQASASGLAAILAAYVVGSAAGGAIAARLARQRARRAALLVGVLLTVLGGVNLVMLPHPAWFGALSLLCYLPPAWLGGAAVGALGTDDSTG